MSRRIQDRRPRARYWGAVAVVVALAAPAAALAPTSLAAQENGATTGQQAESPDSPFDLERWLPFLDRSDEGDSDSSDDGSRVPGLPPGHPDISGDSGSGSDSGSPYAWGGPGSDGPAEQANARLGTRVDSAPGVVLITSTLAQGESAGTGSILTADGQVLTNYHVVEESTNVRVTVADTGDSYEATVLGADKTHDIALLQLQGASGLSTMRMDTGGVSVGEDVTAYGNPSGSDRLYKVSGTITATDDSIEVGDSLMSMTSSKLSNLIRTDADVISGYSGGPLLDDAGEMVGMTTAASTGSNPDGYAIPIARAESIVGVIRGGQDSGTVRVGPTGALGVTVSSQRGSGGVVVADFADDSPARAAGITAGARITAIGETAVADASALKEAVSAHEPGEQVTVTWTDAAGRSHTTTVTLGASPVI